MNSKHDIETYTRLASAAKYFLESSFLGVNRAMKDEAMAVIYAEEIMKVELPEKDKKMFLETKFSSNPVELLQSHNNLSISGELMNNFLKAGKETDRRILSDKIKFNKKHKINSIEVLGGINNFGFFVETIINRHLLFLSQIKVIDSMSYSRISEARIMERIIYLFKAELNNNTLQLNEIINLFSLRNKTVHFTPKNAKALSPEIIQLIKIWDQSIQLIKRCEKKENFNEEKFSDILQNYMNLFKSEWI